MPTGHEQIVVRIVIASPRSMCQTLLRAD